MPPPVENIPRQSPQPKRQPSPEKQKPAGNNQHHTNNQQCPSNLAQRFHPALILSNSVEEREPGLRLALSAFSTGM
jgi:hypothetical protein